MVGRSILNARGIDPCDPSSLIGIGCTPLEDGSACGAQVLSCFDGIDVRAQARIFRLDDTDLYAQDGIGVSCVLVSSG